ncbi:MAG: CinA family protein, partial [Candidatus Omnitrophica bacterium]|nr:CinA family protein [Candidatus Omnitrophota bacterium]
MKQSIVKQLHLSLLKKQKTIAVAESCTGGLVSYLLTQNPGSSRYFLLGIVAYSNEAKEKILNVPPSLIFKKGAVCKEVAFFLAENVRKITQADFGIGLTGIAGPTGGTKRKPVGTVFIAIDT